MSGPNGTREGFDANARASRREQAPITIGEKVYFPARLTNSALRTVRSMARRAGTEARKAGKESEDYALAYQEALEAGIEEAEARKLAEDAGDGSDEVAEINTASLAEQLPQLLRDEHGHAPTQEEVRRFLDEQLDARDVGPLMTFLMGDEDPTPQGQTPTGTPTTS